MEEFLIIPRLHICTLIVIQKSVNIFSHCFEDLHPISPDEALSYDPSPLQSVLSKTLYFAFHLHSEATSWLAATWSFWHTFRLNDSSSSWHLRRKWGNSFRFWQKRAGANPREDLQPWVTGVATPYMSAVRNYLGSSLGMVMDGAILYHSYIICNYITTKWCDCHLPCWVFKLCWE